MNTGRLIFAGSTALIACALAGCHGTTARNEALEQARLSVSHAGNDPRVLAHAPVELRNAQQALQESERLWQDNEDRELIEHQAYLAAQKARLAEQVAVAADATGKIKVAEAERAQALLATREMQAERLRKQLADLQARQTERGLVLTLGDVLFDVDRAELKPGAALPLDRLATFLRDNPARRVVLEGHADSAGSSGYNWQLSERRAEAVRVALLARGVPAGSINVQPFGEEYPVASNDTAAGRQQNRRVEVVISDENGKITERTAMAR